MMKRNKTLKFNIQDQNILFTSDLHLCHDNIIKYCNRPFNDIHEMNNTLVNNWNDVVDDNDVIFILGDFCLAGMKEWKYFLNKLNGKKYLIKGNHDKSITCEEFARVENIINIIVTDDNLKNKEQRFTLCHYPMLSWYQSHRGSIQLFGHLHGHNSSERNVTSKFSPNQLEVGVDIHNFKPISYQEIMIFIKKQQEEYLNSEFNVNSCKFVFDHAKEIIKNTPQEIKFLLNELNNMEDIPNLKFGMVLENGHVNEDSDYKKNLMNNLVKDLYFLNAKLNYSKFIVKTMEKNNSEFKEK